MTKWNEQAAANNNLPSSTIRSSELFLGKKADHEIGKKADHEFSEDLSDGGERNENIEKLINDSKMK
ncbi:MULTISPECIES: hypothetical protein [unclassified Bacillus (in: firmicutes)]|uniref:hypothetical protein n=1 Tax=unclassified Bacillus (in: firmicutes) TaxID=185979 RepID=UPI000BF14754|nr:MULTISPECIES: hypothetical protein [unclassified Bacillus (in: firmicutes)]PEJ59120.1 hypothetical protein CN692_06475 [Bacillus sp. AFS002410]PEL14337.1 hypothetical protein CN601_00225 [Bacillus sp. AFS017336]